MAPRRKRGPPGSRLDERGYLMEDPDALPLQIAEWEGEFTGTGVELDFSSDADGEEIKVTYYTTLVYGEMTINAGDVVYLTADEEGDACEIATVVKFYDVEDEDNPMRMTVEWWWRPEHLKLPEGTVAGFYELFMSTARDAHFAVEAIEK